MAKTPEKSPSSAHPRMKVLPAPVLSYRPRDPKRFHPGIALVGCGGISAWHLRAYQAAKYRVVALCDVMLDRARERRDEFFPDALATDSLHVVLARDDVQVVDITTHPLERPPLVEAALRARKHVLSQKPFVIDLDVGLRLADLADEMGVRLAVNQNGRWAPHFSYIREAVVAGLLGAVDSIHCGVHWDHSWVQGTAFESVRHLILYDFGIHWFDFVRTLMGEQSPRRVFASMTRSATQAIDPALMAQAIIEYDSTQVTLVFDGFTRFNPIEHTLVSGDRGILRSAGPDSKTQRVELAMADGVSRPRLKGKWFPDGFHGTMAELLCAIAENREPTHSARNNLASLSLCYAAVASAERGEAVVPGTVRQLPQG
ncbi:MAG: Gfo/Idh/MocA family oxidoreductase [Pirellulales bacterium]|nr:Gfo/Idh/MocA family oxidoreductase [Pirellulales bacterium]